MGHMLIAAALAAALLAAPGSPSAAPQTGAGRVTVEQVTYRGWKNSYRLSNGRVSVAVVPAIGGRIMEFSLDGRKALWENPAELGKTYPLAADPWRNYGGYKSWNAPQDRWGWPPDPHLDRGPARVRVLRDARGRATGLEVTGQESPRFRLRFTKRLTLDPRTGVLRLEQRMRNTSSRPQTWSLWDVTQVPSSGRVVLEVNPSSRFPGGVYYYDEKAKQSGQAARQGRLAVVTWKGQAAKFGFDCDAGWMARLAGPIAYVKRFPRLQRGAAYPDKGSYAQVFTNGRELPYVEMEIAGPLVRLAPGQETTLVEEWELVRLGGSSGSVPAAIRTLRARGVLRPAR